MTSDPRRRDAASVVRGRGRIGSLVLCLAAVVLSGAGPTGAGPPPGFEGQRERALKVATAELVKLAKWCQSSGAGDEALANCRLGLLLDPRHEALRKLALDLGDDERSPQGGFEPRYRTRKASAHAKAAKALLAYATWCRQRQHLVGLWEGLSWLQWHFRGAVDVGQFSPTYVAGAFRWMDGASAAAWNAGQAWTDGRWVPPDELGEVDRSHAAWISRRTLEGPLVELHHTVPTRLAASAHVLAQECYALFVARFADRWTLEQIERPLALALVQDARQGEEASQTLLGRPAGQREATQLGHYAPGPMQLLPGGEVRIAPGASFVVAGDGTTSEPMEEAGRVLSTVQHELAHHVAFELSAPTSMQRGDGTVHHTWLVEGLASYMEDFALGPEGWAPRHLHATSGTHAGRLSAVKERLAAASMPLPQLAKMGHSEFMGRNAGLRYAQSAAVLCFLLDHADRLHRSRAIDLLQAVHGAGAFLEQPPVPDDETLRAWDEQWRAWLARVEFE